MRTQKKRRGFPGGKGIGTGQVPLRLMEFFYDGRCNFTRVKCCSVASEDHPLIKSCVFHYEFEFMLKTILSAIRSSVKSTVKGSVKTDAQILAYFRKNPTGTVAVIAKQLGLSTRAIEKHIAALKKENRLIRTGSPRSGFWEVRDVCGKDSICGEKDDGH